MASETFTFFYSVSYTPGSGEATILGDGGSREFVLVGDADDILEQGQTVTFVDPTDNSTFTGTFLGVTEDGILVDADGIYSEPVILANKPITELAPVQTVDEGAAYTVVCFLPGTMIATPDGERAIETFREGDLVLTHDGATAPVRWRFVQTVATRFADPLRVAPIRIRAGALGANQPARDLRVSVDHALLIDDALVQAGALVNGRTIVRETDLPERLSYHHLELADHALILAEGVAAETFIDTVTRRRFDNWADYTARYGAGEPIQEMDLPRIKSARQRPGFKAVA